MTPGKFKELAVRLNGGKQHGSLKAAADTLGVHPGTVTRWVKGEVPIPEMAEVAITSRIELRMADAKLERVYDALGL